ncbi:unnamed protein product [Blepharisma stoltei]|uniref:Uncharacterized protein n=1 Tax=Blepharisma stoltei TaxID=1481888 RepID=A0AAU9IX85_9CILI|nr:unnamed protein product [Blepharisma stoltei]
MSRELNERSLNIRRAIKKTYVGTHSRWVDLVKQSKSENSFVELLDRRIILNIEKKNQRILGVSIFGGIVSCVASYNYILNGTHKAFRIGISLIYFIVPIKIGQNEFSKSWTLRRMLTTKYKTKINENKLP